MRRPTWAHISWICLFSASVWLLCATSAKRTLHSPSFLLGRLLTLLLQIQARCATALCHRGTLLRVRHRGGAVHPRQRRPGPPRGPQRHHRLLDRQSRLAVRDSPCLGLLPRRHQGTNLISRPRQPSWCLPAVLLVIAWAASRRHSQFLLFFLRVIFSCFVPPWGLSHTDITSSFSHIILPLVGWLRFSQADDPVWVSRPTTRPPTPQPPASKSVLFLSRIARSHAAAFRRHLSVPSIWDSSSRLGANGPCLHGGDRL